MKTENNNPQEHDELGCWPTKSLMKYCEEHFPEKVTKWKTKQVNQNEFCDEIVVYAALKQIEITTETWYENKYERKHQELEMDECYKIDMTELERVF